MEEKEYLNVFIKLRTLEIRYQSNLNEEDILILKSFLLLLRTKGISSFSNVSLSQNGHKLEIQENVEKSKNNTIKEIYDDYLKSILQRVRKLYLQDLYDIYFGLSDSFISSFGIKLFDSQIQWAFVNKQANNSASMQPLEITEILNSFLPEKDKLSYFNPFAGLASLSLKLPENVTYYGEEINEKSWLLGKMRMLIYDCPTRYSYTLTNSIENLTFISDLKYDYISYNPPFNIKLDKSYLPFLSKSNFGYLGNANSLIVSETFKLLKPSGTMVFVSPSGFLFSSNKQDLEFKKYLCQNGFIKKIIALPEQILSFTSLSVNIILLVKTERLNGEIEFIDATDLVNDDKNKLQTIKIEETLELISTEKSRLKRKVTIDEIETNEFNLSVNRYVHEDLEISVDDQTQLVKLNELVLPLKYKKVTNNEGKLIRIRDLASDPIEYKKSFDGLAPILLKNRANKVDTNTLLLATAWKSLKPTFFEGDDYNIYYDYNSILALKINEEKVDKEYLILELSKDYIQKQVDQRRTGSVQSRITRKDLLQIFIVLPDLETQKRKKYDYQESVIKEHQATVNELISQYGIDVADENSFLKHKIAGTLKNLRGSFSKLKQIIEEQLINELPHLYNYKAHPKLDSNFLDYLNRIERDLNSIHNSVRTVGLDLNLHEIKLEPIDFVKFITEYSEQVKNRKGNQFVIKTDIDEEFLKEHRIKEVTVYGDRDFLSQAFNNIIGNAERHAFKDVNSNVNRIQIDLIYNLEDLEVQMDFSNTGMPMPMEFSWEGYIRKGSKTGDNAGNGIGGWFINEVMKRHNGKLDMTDETGPEGIGGDLVTTIELTFPIKIK